MAQAECITTAIRELMSRGRPPKSTNPVRAAHSEFVAALAGNVPHPIHSDAGSEDLEGRADHLEKVFAALPVYLTAIIPDMAQTIPGVALDHATLTTCSTTCRPTRWASSAMLQRKCASTRIGGHHDPPVRERTDFSQTP